MNKKYFSKALCYADRAQYFSILIITSLYLVCCGLILITDGPKAVPRFIDIAITALPIVIINGLIVFLSYTGKKTKRFYMATQSYNKDTMIITKLISFSLSYIIPVVIYAVIISLLYLTDTKGLTDVINSAVSSPLLKLWKNVIFTSVSFISLVSGVQFLQILFGKCRYALLIPFVFGCLIIPITGTLIVLYLTGVSSSLGNHVYSLAKGSADFLMSYANTILDNFGLACINDLVHIAVFTPLTIFLNRKVKSEKTADIFMFKPIETICKVLLAIFIGFCAVSVVAGIILLIAAKISSSSIDIDIPDTIASIICFVIMISGTALSVGSYKIINKIQARRA